MGYRTIQHVPRFVTTYERALKIHDDIVPIRNHAPERRPLGNRRDHNTYWCRVRVVGDGARLVEFMLYRTAVVTYHPDGTIYVTTGGYDTQSTHQFITRVLGIQANGWSDYTKLTLRGQVYVLKRDEILPLRHNAEGQLTFGLTQERTGYVMNRKKSTAVRARYREFTDYFKGLMKVKAQEIQSGWYAVLPGPSGAINPVERYVQAVVITMEELKNVPPLGMVFETLYLRRSLSTTRANDTRNAQHALMLSLITSDQPEETKAENFYKAALALLAGRGVTAGHTTIARNYDNAIRDFDLALMLAHAREVLDKKVLTGEEMPNRKYVGWVTD